MPTRVILVRHGRSTFNEQGRYQGSSDEAVLNDKGRLDAGRVGAALRGIHIDAVYASPLKRVQETVDGILNTLGAAVGQFPIHFLAELREIDLPAWQGLSFKYVQEELIDDYQCWKQRPHEFQMRASAPEHSMGGDEEATTFPVLDLYQRAEQFWREVLPRHVGQTLLLVSHGGTNHALISTALGISPTHHHSLQQSNCGVSFLTFGERERPHAKLDALNLTTPLGETLPKLKEGKQGLRLLLIPSDSIQNRQCQQLAAVFKEIAINFSLSETLEPTQRAVEQILHYHPNTLQLEILRQDFSKTWRRTLETTPWLSKQLITGLVVADSIHIQCLLGQAIGLDEVQYWRLQIRPGTFSVLHYPSVEARPVLQALNIAPNMES
ncbi:MAG: histidine phosphatase family protein [Leptolyngbyaceae cyanobacterium MO_188.B28]|nr:histidine phosphatase family protein [Leptolyngbyaceae cyanobacterium MO_188.B28]